MGDTHAPPPMDVLVPVPPIVSRRAWECAFFCGQFHSRDIRSAAHWHLFQNIVTGRDPEDLTWAECAELFRAYRYFREGARHV